MCTQSCPTLCDPLDCSPSGSSIHEVFQARILEWVAISYSRGSFQPRDRTCIPCIAGGFLTSEPPGKPLVKMDCCFCCSVAESCPTRCNPVECSTPGFPAIHRPLEFAQTHVHCQWCHPAISSSVTSFSSCFSISQHQGLFQWVSSLHHMAKVLEFQLQHQSFQWIFRVDFL